STLLMRSGDEATDTTTLKGTVFASKLQRAGESRLDIDGTQRMWAEARVPTLGWHVLAGISTNEALADARKSLRDRAKLGVMMAIIVMIAAATLKRRLVRPLRSLSSATTRVSAGDLDVRIEPQGPAEIA